MFVTICFFANCVIVIAGPAFTTASYSRFFNRGGGWSCRPIFNEKTVLIEGGMHVGKYSIEKGC